MKYFGDSGQLANQYHPNNELWGGVHDEYNENRIAFSVDENRNYVLDGVQYGVWWWLRSPGGHGALAAFVDINGVVRVHGFSVNGGTYGGGVRPALWLNLESTTMPIPTTPP